MAASETKLLMVLPAYNEAADLPALFVGLERAFGALAGEGFRHEYVLVDDGSTDATPRILADHQKRLPMTVLTHDPNQGLGATIRDGLRRAAEMARDGDIIFSMDADNTHPPELIAAMTRAVLAGSDVVIASRYQPGAAVVGLSRFREIMSIGARFLFRLMFPIPGVRDYTCGYRAYRAGVIRRAFRVYGEKFIEHDGFQCMADILLRLSRLRVTMSEVPMVLRYDRKGGASKMRVGPTVVNTFKLMIRRRLERAPAAACAKA